MHDLFKNWNGLGYRHNLYYIDAGNGRYSGQVVTGYREVNKLILPPVGEIFPDAIIEDDEPPRSCVQNALEAPQNIGANDLAATMVFSVLNILLTEEEINSHILTFDGRRQEFLSRTCLLYTSYSQPLRYIVFDIRAMVHALCQYPRYVS